ncbi:hypothetical protein [Spongorhabdus nitratireducens]
MRHKIQPGLQVLLSLVLLLPVSRGYAEHDYDSIEVMIPRWLYVVTLPDSTGKMACSHIQLNSMSGSPDNLSFHYLGHAAGKGNTLKYYPIRKTDDYLLDPAKVIMIFANRQQDSRTEGFYLITSYPAKIMDVLFGSAAKEPAPVTKGSLGACPVFFAFAFRCIPSEGRPAYWLADTFLTKEARQQRRTIAALEKSWLVRLTQALITECTVDEFLKCPAGCSSVPVIMVQGRIDTNLDCTFKFTAALVASGAGLEPSPGGDGCVFLVADSRSGFRLQKFNTTSGEFEAFSDKSFHLPNAPWFNAPFYITGWHNPPKPRYNKPGANLGSTDFAWKPVCRPQEYLAYKPADTTTDPFSTSRTLSSSLPVSSTRRAPIDEAIYTEPGTNGPQFSLRIQPGPPLNSHLHYEPVSPPPGPVRVGSVSRNLAHSVPISTNCAYNRTSGLWDYRLSTALGSRSSIMSNSSGSPLRFTKDRSDSDSSGYTSPGHNGFPAPGYSAEFSAVVEHAVLHNNEAVFSSGAEQCHVELCLQEAKMLLKTYMEIIAHAFNKKPIEGPCQTITKNHMPDKLKLLPGQVIKMGEPRNQQTAAYQDFNDKIRPYRPGYISEYCQYCQPGNKEYTRSGMGHFAGRCFTQCQLDDCRGLDSSGSGTELVFSCEYDSQGLISSPSMTSSMTSSMLPPISYDVAIAQFTSIVRHALFHLDEMLFVAGCDEQHVALVAQYAGIVLKQHIEVVQQMSGKKLPSRMKNFPKLQRQLEELGQQPFLDRQTFESLRKALVADHPPFVSRVCLYCRPDNRQFTDKGISYFARQLLEAQQDEHDYVRHRPVLEKNPVLKNSPVLKKDTNPLLLCKENLRRQIRL